MNTNKYLFSLYNKPYLLISHTLFYRHLFEQHLPKFCQHKFDKTVLTFSVMYLS
jgi:hypothetical protein